MKRVLFLGNLAAVPALACLLGSGPVLADACNCLKADPASGEGVAKAMGIPVGEMSRKR